MYYVIKVDTENLNANIIGSCSFKNELERTINKLATEFIKEEEGTKKAKDSFVKNIEELKTDTCKDGYYLLKKDDNVIEVYKKETVIVNGYIMTSIDHKITHVYKFVCSEYIDLTENVCTNNVISTEKSIEQQENVGSYNNVLVELKRILAQRNKEKIC